MRQEKCLDGSKDENVFDIQQGVAITVFVKSGKKTNSALGKVYHYDLYGKRDEKYEFLSNKSLNEVGFKKVTYDTPYYFFNPKSFVGKESYDEFINLDKLFRVYTSGIVTMGDNFILSDSETELNNRLENFLKNDVTPEQFRKEFKLGKNYPDWLINNKVKISNSDLTPVKIAFRPFDNKFTIYSEHLLWRRRESVLSNMLYDDNYALLTGKQNKSDTIDSFFITNTISETKCAERTIQSYSFPLYLYPEQDTQTELLESKETRTPNLDLEIVADIAKGIGLTFTNEKEDTAGTFAPIDILDYIYAVLHSPTYRETYKEFLKIDFPRVPYPSNADTFWQLVALGSELRQTHLLESLKLAAQTKALGIGYPVGGDNAVTRKMTKTSVGFEPDEVDSSIGKVWLNDTQYFTNVPLVAWEFYIGGYQPAQKWLKDRQGRTLDISDVRHYMNIIAALSLTHELMQQIDNIDVVG